MSNQKNKKTTVLCILDGWGIAEDKKYSAIDVARTDFYDSLLTKYPNTTLEASGVYVGLSEGQMGNSEVGHTNIGAGRVILQELPRINKTCQDNKMRKNKTLVKTLKLLKKSGGDLHLLGLLSDGGVHSHITHIIEIAKIAAKEKITVYLHAFLDGRDTPQKSALTYLEQFKQETEKFDNISIASIAGRYYAMDRDNRWDRIEKAYNVIVKGQDNKDFKIDPARVIEESYLNNITDEFIEPISVNNYAGMKDGDAFIFANFRADRARELSMALASPNFSGFTREKIIDFSAKVQMTEYSSEHSTFMTTMFESENVEDSLGEIIAKHGLTQLRIAETEKYAHVTFFFSGGREEIFSGEDRILVNSPKVATYDLQPEMSAVEVNTKLMEAIKSGKYDFIVVNFANADMVGHTGKMDAAVKACETLDAQLQQLVATVQETNGIICITADHGNAERMFDEEKNQVYTAHTTNKVPFILIGADDKYKLRDGGALCDIAPTILKLMGFKAPRKMKGKSLVK